MSNKEFTDIDSNDFDEIIILIDKERDKNNKIETTILSSNRDILFNKINQILNSPGYQNIGKSIYKLWTLMSKYIQNVNINNYRIFYIKDFIQYLPEETKINFSQIVNHNKGIYLTMWFWRISPAVFLYICTREKYDSSGETDYFKCDRRNLKIFYFYLMKIKEELIKKDNTITRRSDLIVKFTTIADKIREIVDNNICNTFTNLNFYETFDDAKMFILNSAKGEVTFDLFGKKVIYNLPNKR